MNPIYIIDWYKFVIWNIASTLQQYKLVVFAKAIIQPIIMLYNDFLLFQKQTYIVINTTGQVCKLRGGLNNNFDPSLRRITITNGVIQEIVYAYLQANPTQHTYMPQYMFSSNGVKFIVNVPTALNINDAQIRQFLNTYKLPTTKYTINYV